MKVNRLIFIIFAVILLLPMTMITLTNAEDLKPHILFVGTGYSWSYDTIFYKSEASSDPSRWMFAEYGISDPTWDINQDYVAFESLSFNGEGDQIIDSDIYVWTAGTPWTAEIISKNFNDDFDPALYKRCSGDNGFKIAWVTKDFNTTLCPTAYNAIMFDDCGEEPREIACGYFDSLSWNPNGTQLVTRQMRTRYYTEENQLLIRDLYILDVDRNIGDTFPYTLQRITNDNSINEDEPDWSNNGDYIVYTHENFEGTEHRPEHIYISRAEPIDPLYANITIVPRQVTSSGRDNAYPVWSPDDSQIIFQRQESNGNNNELMIIDSGCDSSMHEKSECNRTGISGDRPNRNIDSVFGNLTPPFSDLAPGEEIEVEYQQGYGCYISAELKNIEKGLADKSVTRLQFIKGEGLGQVTENCLVNTSKLDGLSSVMVECDELIDEGEWEVWMNADYDVLGGNGSVDETNENNNDAYVGLISCYNSPDLIPVDVHVEWSSSRSLPPLFWQEHYCSVSADLKNIGTAATDDISGVRIDMEKLTASNNDTCTRGIPVLGPGQSYTADCSGNQLFDGEQEDGRYGINVHVDYTATMYESNKENNVEYYVPRSCGDIDLVIPSQTFNETRDEEYCYVSAQINNEGGDIATYSYTRFEFVGTTQTITCDAFTPEIDPESSVMVTCPEGIPVGTNWTVTMYADQERYIGEYNGNELAAETNNEKYIGNYACEEHLPDLYNNEAASHWETYGDDCYFKTTVTNELATSSAADEFEVNFVFDGLNVQRTCKASTTEDLIPGNSTVVRCNESFPRDKGTLYIDVNHDGRVKEEDDTNNKEVVLNFDCGNSNGLPDLIPVNDSSVGSGWPGDCEITSKVRNQGHDVANFSSTKMKLREIVRGSGYSIENISTSAMSPSTESSITLTSANPGFSPSPGTYEVTLTADVNDIIVEGYEENNERSAGYATCPGPDLVPVPEVDPYGGTLEVETDGSGERCKVTAEVGNDGAFDATASNTKFKFVRSGVEYVTYVDTPAISALSSTNVETGYVLGGGIWEVFLDVDYDWDVKEEHEDNNYKSVGSIVCEGDYFPDLLPAPTNDYHVVDEGGCNISTRIKNKGEGTALQSTTFVSLASVYGGPTIENCSIATDSISSGEWEILTCGPFNVQTWYVSVMADSNDSVDEISELNNIDPLYSIVSCMDGEGEPDLKSLAYSVDDYVSVTPIGNTSNCSVEVTTQNTGGSSAGPSVTKVWIYYPDWAGAKNGDTILREYLDVPGLSSDAEIVQTLEGVIPEGYYYATISVDYGIYPVGFLGNVQESDEYNNFKYDFDVTCQSSGEGQGA
jgi:hypothetical protein